MNFKEYGAVAQLGERHAGSVEVGGSSPLSSTIKEFVMKASIEKVFSVFDSIRNIDLEGFLDDAKRKIDELKENPTHFTLSAILQLKLAYEMFDCYLKKECSLPWKTVVAIFSVLLYLINPFDVIPDFLPGIGYLDDAVVIGLALKLFRDELKDFAISRGLNLSEYGLD